MAPAIFTVQLPVTSENWAGLRATLKVELPFAPVKGMEFHHIVWHDARPAVNVTWDLLEKYFSVNLGDDRTQNREQLRQYVEMYEGHGWTVENKELAT